MTVGSVASPSATLALDERIRALAATGADVVHLGFGEAGLPVLPELAAELAAGAGANGYGPVAGRPEARAAAAGWFDRRGLPTSPEQIVLAPGSKALLYALLSVLPGDVVLPQPCWVSYAAQAALAGKRVIAVPVPDDSGGLPDPLVLERALAAAGRRPGVLVATIPDNPTGAVASPELVREVTAVADRHGLAVVSDEIYRDLAYRPGALLSPAAALPARSIVTGGLSKALALGGWRIGFARLPEGSFGERVRAGLLGMASEIWSSLAAPMQRAGAFALSDPPSVQAHVAACRRLHRAVTEAAWAAVTGAGAECRRPVGGFYLYPDLEPARSRLAAAGVHGAEDLAARLLDDFGVAVLPGTAFGDDPAGLRFRVATSLLHGDSEEERWAALRAPDPAHLPRVRRALDRLAAAVGALAGRCES